MPKQGVHHKIVARWLEHVSTGGVIDRRAASRLREALPSFVKAWIQQRTAATGSDLNAMGR